MFLLWCVEWCLLYVVSFCTCLYAGFVFDCFKAIEVHERKLTKEMRVVAEKATKTVRVIKRAGKGRLKKHSHRLTGILFNVAMVTSLAWIVCELQKIEESEESGFNKYAWIKNGVNKTEFGKLILDDNRYLDYLMSVLLLGSCDDKFDLKIDPGVRDLSWLRQGIHFLEPRKIFTYPSSIQRYFQEYMQQKPKAELMKYEWARYETFKTFPQWSPAMPTRLAATGFYYTGYADEVECFSCGIKHRGWQGDDIPSFVHMSRTPDCHMVLNPSSVNVPIGEPEPVTDGGAHYLMVNVECDKPSKENVEKMESASSPDTRSEANTSQSNDEMLSNSKYPEYAELIARLDSFRCWPIGDIIKPEHLAEAGFYYAGFGDCVRCYHCGGGLRNWDRGDCVWTEHARIFPSCEYIINKKRQNTKRLQGHDRGACGTTSSKSSSHIQDGGSSHRETVQESTTDQKVFTCNPNSTRRDIDRDINRASRDIKKTYAGHSVMQPETVDTSGNVNAGKKEIHKKTQALRQHVICKICMDQYSEIVFLPCGHLIACSSCASNIRKCAMCRTKIKGRVRALMS